MIPALLAGVFDLALALFHLSFWRLLGWPATLGGSGRVNAAVTQVLNVMLAYVFATVGAALVAYSLAARPLAPIVPLAAAGFWLLRLVLQPLMFPPAAGWSIGLAAVFAVGAALHGWAAFG